MTVMPSSSDVADKAVSTEDASCAVEVASIDALLAALVETKVEAMKASSSSTMTRRFGSAPASPRRTRLTSSSTVSSSQNHHHLHHCHGDHHHHHHHHRHHGEHHHHRDHHHYGDRYHYGEHHHGDYRDHYHGEHPGDLQEELEDQGNYYLDYCSDRHDHKDHYRGDRHRHGRKYEKRKRDRHRRHGSAPCGEFIENTKLYEHQAHRSEKGKRRASECPRSPRKKRRHSKNPHILQEDILDLPVGLDAPFELLGIDGDQDLGLINLSKSREAFSDICEYPRLHQSACYTSQSEAQLKIHYDEDDDFLALNLEDDLDDDETLSSPEKVDDPVERFHRPRKKRKRRRRKVEREIVEIEREITDPDELPPRARLTIVATACLLLAMSLLLVGITLRMAPIIDEMGDGRRASVCKRGKRRPSTAHRRNSVRPSRAEIKVPPIALKTPEEIQQARRHRRIAMFVVGTFVFLLVASVLAVVVTLTHSSFYIPPIAPNELNKLQDQELRKENEALLNSLNRDSTLPENSTASP